MCDGYKAAGEDDHPQLEDELLCEYVDGTMDPVVQEVFEEYVRANPDLGDHIESLRHTRLLLCRYGCRCHAPRDLHDRLRRQITCDLINGRVQFHVVVADRLKGFATASSTVAFLLVMGLLGGVVVYDAGDENLDTYPRMVSAAVLGADDASGADSYRYAVGTGGMSVLQTAPFSPRKHEVAPLRATQSLVASRLEQELRSASAQHRVHVQMASALVP